MKNIAKVFFLTVLMLAACAGAASATPSTQIWIPSTDVQAYKTLHLGIDNYIRVKRASDGSRWPTAYDVGLTAGVLPFEKLQMEVGIDYIYFGVDAMDNHPIYFNAKLATPENSLFKNSPAIAVGGYNFGLASETNLNLVYGLVAKTIPIVGRLSAGYYVGNDGLLVDQNGAKAEHGILLSWDRVISEIDDRLWVGVDYQGGENAFGALNFGASWAFSKNVSVIFGYDIYNRKATGGEQTFTTQVDINFP